MPETLDLKNVVEDIVSSYEKRIESISSTFDTVNLILDDLQESFFNTKEEREKTSTQLRDILAKNEHLRRKDFDNMMQGILKATEEREREVKDLLKSYFNEQRTIAEALKENLAKFKNSLARGEAERVKEFQALIKDILKKQEERRQEITSNLKGFQQQQGELIISLRELSAQGRNLRIKDFKLMLREFRTQRDERLVLQKRRKKAVASMLEGFRKERLKIRSSPKAIYPVRNIGDTPKENKISNGVNIDAQGGNKNISNKIN